MSHSQISVKTSSGEVIYGNAWVVDEGKPKANIVIVHGMGEYSYRYDHFASYLTSLGYNVYAVDQPGHGLNVTVPETPELGLGVWPDNGFKLATTYIYELVTQVRLSMIPTILFAHSMGSLVAQRYYQRFNSTIDGLILCGSNANCFTYKISRTLARVMKVFLNPERRKKPSKFFASMQRLAFNRGFKDYPDHYKTGHKWLSVDEENVKAFDKDPLCGFTCSFNYYYNLFYGLKPTFQKHRVREILHPVPILLIAGSEDPVGRKGKGVKKLRRFYETNGQDVSMNLYPGLRHEILNESPDVRSKIYADIGAFIERCLTVADKAEAGQKHRVSSDL